MSNLIKFSFLKYLLPLSILTNIYATNPLTQQEEELSDEKIKKYFHEAVTIHIMTSGDIQFDAKLKGTQNKNLRLL